MTSIVELFPKCRKLAYDARQQLAQVQTGVSSLAELSLVVEELLRQLSIMDELVLRETPAQRDVWRRKIEELRTEALSMQQSGQQAAAQQRYRSDRHELLRRRRRHDNESDLQTLAEESSSLEQSHFMVGDLLNQGQASLSGLVESRQRLRGIKQVVLGIGNTLNLSQSTMRIIERRDITDAYLVAAGMLVTLVVLYLTWF